MSDNKQITLPVLGMTCANCVAAVERNSKKVDGVTDATVNYASEKVTFTYDPALTSAQQATTQVIQRVERAGYKVPTTTIELPLVGMTCANCASTIERRLNKTDGVLEAAVNYASEKAVVTYAPGAVSRPELVAAVRKAGYDVVETADGEDLVDAEAAAREAEVRHQEKRLIVGLDFHCALIPSKYGPRFWLVRGMGARPVGQLALFRAGDAGAILCRLGLLRRRI